MPPMPPSPRPMLIANAAIFGVDHLLLGGLLSQWFALWPLGVNFCALSGRDLRLPARQRDAPVLQHARPVDVRLELERVWGPSATQFYVASLLAAAGMQLVVNMLSDRRSRRSARRRAVRPAARLRHDVPEPDHHALFPPIPMKAKTFVMVFGGLSCCSA